LVLACLLAAAPAVGQQAAPPPAGEDEAPECTPQEPCLTAGRQEQITREHARALGFVDLSFGDSRIQADELDLFTTTHADGRETHRIEARKNVVFLRGEERLAGDSLVMDLSTGRGTFENALGYTSPGVFIEARRIERLDAENYRIEGGKFTSCAQPTPRWSFSATSANVKVDDRILARNVVMKVKQVPAFYMPIFMYPIQEDQRSSGFLFPRFGKDTFRGYSLGTGFFWAMGRSFDQTFYYDYYSDYGAGYGHEFRYALASPSNGTFRTYLFRRTQGGQAGWEHDINWAAVQMLPGRVRMAVRAQESSTIQFQEQFQDDLDLASRRNRFSNLSLQRAFGPTNIQLIASSNDTFFGSTDEFIRRRQRPTLQIGMSPRKIGRTGLVFSYDTRAENLEVGNQDRVDRFGRYDLNPRLSRPFSVSFLQITPEVQVRHTRYAVSDLDPDSYGNQDLSGPPVTRNYREASVEMRGPNFSRVFDTPGNFYSDRYKHVIGPEVTWTYRSAPSTFSVVPIFDGHDPVPGTNEVRYALVQRFYSKRRGAGGRAEPYEFLNWRVSQTYYVNADAAQFDPSYASSPFGGPGGEAASLSPLQSRFRFRPAPQFSTNFDMEYDVNFKQLKYVSLSANASYARMALQASWFRGNRVTERVDRRGINRDTLRGSTRLVLWPGKLAVDGSMYYDLLSKNLRQWNARARYDVQCCGFIAEVIDSDYNAKQSKEYRFSIELANIGSIGNFGEGTGTGFRSAR
ncbi:MAG TPA: LPS assembly protein LptD, partial [Vicinamibacteria bacterium]|nr:LPS assembly protein LptD [Vicinamibacteria bacterium]